LIQYFATISRMNEPDVAANLTDPTKYLAHEVASQGLGEPTAPAPVEIPPPGVPRAGGFPIAPELGALGKLPGNWVGSGFNLIARPDKQGGRDFFLELDNTKETLEFTSISSPIPNRGSKQDDITFLGLTYLQQVSDALTNGALHIEPGIWLNVPATTAPQAEASVVRLATVPHGNSLLAQGQGFTVAGPPTIEVASSTPFETATRKPVDRLGYLDPYLNPKLPPGIPAEAVANPNFVLTEAIKDQEISETVVLVVSTEPDGGIENIPFVDVNADTVSMNAIFWIETVQLKGGGSMLQLQYTQTVILDFDEISWPHISVGTLLKF
jgi:hypothetical protein